MKNIRILALSIFLVGIISCVTFSLTAQMVNNPDLKNTINYNIETTDIYYTDMYGYIHKTFKRKWSTHPNGTITNIGYNPQQIISIKIACGELTNLYPNIILAPGDSYNWQGYYFSLDYSTTRPNINGSVEIVSNYVHPNAKVYPNPSKAGQIVNIEVLLINKRFDIYNINGEVIDTIYADNNGIAHWNPKDFASGIYIYKTMGKTGKFAIVK